MRSACKCRRRCSPASSRGSSEGRVHRAVLVGLTGSIFGWPDRKGASDCADEVTLSRKDANSPTRLRPTGTKARARVSNGPSSLIELKKQLEARTRELAEALERQTATSEVLRVISSSPGDLQPVFQTVLANAVRICEATFGTLFLRDGDAFRVVAMHNAPPAYADARKREPLVRPKPDTA